MSYVLGFFYGCLGIGFDAVRPKDFCCQVFLILYVAKESMDSFHENIGLGQISYKLLRWQEEGIFIIGWGNIKKYAKIMRSWLLKNSYTAMKYFWVKQVDLIMEHAVWHLNLKVDLDYRAEVFL